MAGKFEGNTARCRDAFAYPLGQIGMVAIAGREIGARLGDADDRLSALQFLAGEAVIEIALDIERGHSRIIGIVEPQPRAQLLRRDHNPDNPGMTALYIERYHSRI